MKAASSPVAAAALAEEADVDFFFLGTSPLGLGPGFFFSVPPVRRRWSICSLVPYCASPLAASDFFSLSTDISLADMLACACAVGFVGVVWGARFFGGKAWRR